MSNQKPRVRAEAQVSEYKKPKHELIKERIEAWYRYFSDNIANHEKWKKFVFVSTISDDDSAVYTVNQMPKFTCNMLETYMSRIWGELSKQTPDMSATPINDSISATQVAIVEGCIRSILLGASFSELINNVARDQMGASYGVAEVRLNYISPKSFEQDIEILHVKDPTDVGFDPLAERFDKSDGDYSFRIFIKKLSEIEKEHPGIDFSGITFKTVLNTGFYQDTKTYNWNWMSDSDKLIRIYEYYEKQYEYTEIVDVVMDKENHFKRKTMTRKEFNDMMKEIKSDMYDHRDPIIKNSRTSKTYKIVRYIGCSDFLLPPETTEVGDIEDGEVIPMAFLPHVFFDNNSIDVDGKQVCRPYFYGAIDQQRLLDFATSNIVNDLDNIRPTDLFITDQALPDEGSDWFGPYRDPNKSVGTYVYKKYDEQNQENAPPFSMSRNSVSESALVVFQTCQKAIQNILGSFDAQQGSVNETMAGVALNASIAQSNLASMPSMIRLMQSVNQIARIIASIIPNIYVTERTIPITDNKGEHKFEKINDMSRPDSIIANRYDVHDLGIYVKGSINFDAQKEKALKYIDMLMKSSPVFNDFINTSGMNLLLENFDIRNITQLREEFKKYLEMKQMQPSKPDPAMMKLQLDEKELMMKAQIADKEMKFKDEELQISKEELAIKKVDLFGKLVQNERDSQIRVLEAKTEHERTIAMTIAQQDKDNLDKFIAMNKHILEVDKHFSERRDAIEEKANAKEEEAKKESMEKD